VDAIDEKIIAELTRNARISHSEPAGKVLLSRNAMRQRTERLERQGPHRRLHHRPRGRRNRQLHGVLNPTVWAPVQPGPEARHRHHQSVSLHWSSSASVMSASGSAVVLWSDCSVQITLPRGM
jgi:hypothetical protein